MVRAYQAGHSYSWQRPEKEVSGGGSDHTWCLDRLFVIGWRKYIYSYKLYGSKAEPCLASHVETARGVGCSILQVPNLSLYESLFSNWQLNFSVKLKHVSKL